VLRAVVFDAYGTLFRYHEAEFRTAVTDVLTAQGLDHPDHGEVYKTFVSASAPAGPWGDPDDEEHRPDRQHVLDGPLPAWLSQWEIWRREWKITFDTHDLDGDADRATNFLRDELTVAEAYPDALDTLERLAAHGLTLGLLSNADDDFLQGALSRARLRFSAIQSSESLRAYKPNRAIFEAFCRRLNHDPSEVLYVGDSLATDVQGAGNAGLRTAWVRRSERQYSEELPAPDMKVSSLSAIADLLGAP
jgi:2-haloalkanoic acid dehalogenase type II